MKTASWPDFSPALKDLQTKRIEAFLERVPNQFRPRISKLIEEYRCPVCNGMRYRYEAIVDSIAFAGANGVEKKILHGSDRICEQCGASEGTTDDHHELDKRFRHQVVPYIKMFGL